MRVLVALENRFVKTQNGNIYSTTICDYKFWSRYLQVFDKVVVFGRLAEIPEKELDKPQANGLNVRFMAVPYYIGPWQYLKQQHKIKNLAKRAMQEADAFILRVPGRISTLLWHQLMGKKIPYGVEVVGSSLDSAKTSGANVLLKVIFNKIGPKNEREQCRHAVASAYVSESYLQSLYAPGNWSTHYSSIDLPDDAIVDDDELRERFASLSDAVSGQRPFRICHVGSMSALYKAQDVLIEAISLCRAKGLEIQLTLLGDGKYYQRFVKKAKTLGVVQNVQFLGRLPAGGPVREQLDMADLFVLPSLTEGMPRSLIEAMARGLPCIGSNVGGVRELLDAEDLVPPRDKHALVEKIAAVAQDKNKLERMSRRNVQTARKYRAEELNRRRVEFYKKVAELSKAGMEGNNL